MRTLLGGMVAGLALFVSEAHADPTVEPTLPACLAQAPAGTFLRRDLYPGHSFLTYKKLRSAHRKEWLESAVAPELIDHVLVSLPDVACEPGRTGLAQPIRDYLGLTSAEYTPMLARSAWLVRQLDPISLQAVRSQVKLDAGFRLGRHKYEDPTGGRPEIGYLDVPDAIARSVYRRHAVKRARGAFWRVVREQKLPLVITEGAKKAASLLSLGYAAIDLPGVCTGISMRDDKGWSHDPTLRAGLATMIAAGTQVMIVFDHDDAPETQKFVRTVLFYTAQLLEGAGAHVRIAELPGPDKGVDDFLVAHGSHALDAVFARARPFARWRRDNTDLAFLPAIYDIAGCD